MAAEGLKCVRTLADMNREEIELVLSLARKMKEKPGNFGDVLRGKTLVMLFEKPSLRTRLSFEAGMTRMGGHAIFYSVRDSPLGKKESLSDTARCISRFCDVVMARVYSHKDIDELAREASVPVINALDDRCHPCQALADALTISEHVFPRAGGEKRIKVAFMGDAENNMAYAIMRMGAILGMDVTVGCPDDDRYRPLPDVLESIQELAARGGTGARVTVTHDAVKAVAGADVVYTDSWFSYGIGDEEKEARVAAFTPYQVNSQLMAHAADGAAFMNCLPAARGQEQTAEVIDGPQSVVFDEAENRLHAQSALLVYLVLGAHKVQELLAPESGAHAPVVVAVGGNALQRPGTADSDEDLDLAAQSAAKGIAHLPHRTRGAGVVVVHGNGPQVGTLLKGRAMAVGQRSLNLNMCVAASQGEIGAVLSRCLGDAEGRAGRAGVVPVTISSHTVVDPSDPAFQAPTKPVGLFLSEEEAQEARNAGYAVEKEEGKDGPRVVVPSPTPKAVIEIPAAKGLLEAGGVVIMGGGGGVPVIPEVDPVTNRRTRLVPVDAVCDKDLTASIIARELRADTLLILTDIDAVRKDVHDPDTRIASLTLSEARALLKSDTLAAGSMRPKLLACVEFTFATKRASYIGHLEQANDILLNKCGTKIVP